MSATTILVIGIVATMLLMFMMVAAAASGARIWAAVWFIAALASCVWIPFYVDADKRESAARDAKMEQTCARYGGVGTEFGDETGSGKSRVYHRLYMCKEGPRVIYEW